MYDDVRNWLLGELNAQGRDGTVYIEHAKRDNGWLHVPVYVAGSNDAYDIATVLQEVEDSWNAKGSEHEFKLLLVPASK